MGVCVYICVVVLSMGANLSDLYICVDECVCRLTDVFM